MPLSSAILLGAVQGLTEFLPVSSTAHLYLAQALLGIRNDDVTLSFDVVLHLGTVLALVLATGPELLAIAAEALRWAARKPAADPAARAVVLPIVLGTIPGVLAGLFLLKKVESLRSIGLIGLSMLVACVFFLAAEAIGRRRAGRERGLADLDSGDALWVGVAQAAAGLFAGFSRSGFTISTGRARGLAREDAARFSFYLALPIILGAGAKALLDLRKHPEPPIGGAALGAGFVASAIVGYFAVRFLLRFVKTHTLRPFAIYLGLLGSGLLLWSIVRGVPILSRGPV